MLTIENLNEDRTIDRAAAAELQGGMFVPAAIMSWQETTNVFTQNATAITIGAGNQGIVSLGSLNLTPVSAGSAMTWVQSAV